MNSHAPIRFFAHVALGLAGVLCCAIAIAAEDTPEAISLSLVDLTNAPAAYDGKAIVVSGYLAMGFEKHSLCPTPKQAAGKDCVWLSGEAAGSKDLNGKRVTLRGVFSTKFMGHLSCCAGNLRVTQRATLAPEPPTKRRR